MDENANTLQVRPTATGDGQVVSTARRNDTLKHVNAMFDRQEMLERKVGEQAGRMRELEASQGTMSHAIDNHTARISDLVKENGQLLERKKHNEDENEQLRSQRKALQAQIELLKQSSLVSEDHAKNCEEETTKVAASLRAVEEQALKTEAEIQKLRACEKSWLDNIGTLTLKNEEIAQQNDDLVKGIENLRDDMAKKSDDSDKIDALTDEIQVLRQENATLQGTLDTAMVDERNYVGQISSQQGVVEHLSAHNDVLLADNGAKSNEVERLRALLDNDNAETIRLRKTLENQQRRINNFKKELNVIQELRQQKTVADNEVATKVAELETLRQQLSAQTSDMAQLQSEHNISREQNAEAGRTVTRAAKTECQLLLRLSTFERARNELYEFIYAEAQRQAAFEEDYTYIFLNTWELGRADAVARRAEIVDLQARNKESGHTLQRRNEDVWRLEAQLAGLADLQDEILPLKRDLTQTEASLEACTTVKDKLSSDLDLCGKKLASARKEIHDLRGENVRTKGQLAQARSDAEVAKQKEMKALNAQQADLRASLETARTAELTLEQEIAKWKANEALLLPRNASQALHVERRYASRKYVQVDTFGAGASSTALGEQYWTYMEDFYKDVPDRRVKISINDRVLPRGAEPPCDGDFAAITAEISHGESLPTAIEIIEAEKLIDRPWTLTAIDNNQTSWVEPLTDEVVDNLPDTIAQEVVEENSPVRQAIGSVLQPSHEPETMTPPVSSSRDVDVVGRDCARPEEGSLFVSEASVDTDDALGPGEWLHDAVRLASVSGREPVPLQARSDSPVNKQAQLVHSAAVMPTTTTAEPNLKEISSKDYFSQRNVNRICTGVTPTARQHSLPTPLPTPGVQRPAKSVRWAEQLASPMSAVQQSACSSTTLKRPAPDSDALARASKQPRLLRLETQQDDGHRRDSISGAMKSSTPNSIHRRPTRCWHDPKCKRINCCNAHQTPAMSDQVDIDVTRVCEREEDCTDAECRLSHASWTKCMKTPP